MAWIEGFFGSGEKQTRLGTWLERAERDGWWRPSGSFASLRMTAETRNGKSNSTRKPQQPCWASNVSVPPKPRVRDDGHPEICAARKNGQRAYQSVRVPSSLRAMGR